MVSHPLLANPARVTGDLTSFVGELSKRADANGDGQLTAAEFAQFLKQAVDRPSAEPKAAEHSHIRQAIDRVLSAFPSTPAGLLKAMHALQQVVPGTQLVGHGHLDVPGLGVINASRPSAVEK